MSNNSYVKKSSQLANDRNVVLSKIVKLKRKSSLFLFLNRFGKAISVIGMWGAVLWIIGVYWFVLLFSVFLIPHHFGESAFESMNRFLTTAIALFIIPMAILIFLWLSGSWLASNVAVKLSRVAVEICDLQREVQNAQNKTLQIEKRAFEDEQQIAEFPHGSHKKEMPVEEQKSQKETGIETDVCNKKYPFKIADIKDGMRGITVQGQVIEIRTIGEVSTKFGMVFLAIAVLEDDSGRISLNLWKDQINLVKVGDIVRINGSYVIKYENELTLNVWGNKRIKVIWPSGSSDSQLASEIADYIEKTSLESLFDAKRLRRLLLKFWADNYPSTYMMRKDPFIKSKKSEIEELGLEILQSKRERYFESLTQRLTSWGLKNNLTKLTRANVKLFLSKVGLIMDKSSEAMFYHKVKGKWVQMYEDELNRFKSEKTPEALAEEIATYVKEKSEGILLNARTFNELITKFWIRKYDMILSARFGDREITSKMKEAEAMAFIKYLDLLTKDLTEWAQNRNLRRLTRADVRLFLASKNMSLSTSFEQMFYRESKLKYRWLPSWMRE